MTADKTISFSRAFVFGAIFGVIVGFLGNAIMRQNELRYGAMYSKYEWEVIAVPSWLAQSILPSDGGNMQFGEWWSHRYLIVIWNGVFWGIMWVAIRMLWRLTAVRWKLLKHA